MNPGIQGFALSLAILAAAPATWAADSERETATSMAESACRKAVDVGDDADLRQARYAACMINELGFDAGLYLRTTDDADDRNAPGGIVDASHSGGRAGLSWAFAIDRSCPGSVAFPAPCKWDAERLVIRVVSLKRLSAAPLAPKDSSPAGIRAYLDARLDWREADIRDCPNAARTLLSLERARWFAFDDWDRASIAGGQANLIVPGDGPSTVVRARGFASTYIAQEWSDSGGASAWAKRMMIVVEPCLRPSLAPAPWDRP